MFLITITGGLAEAGRQRIRDEDVFARLLNVNICFGYANATHKILLEGGVQTAR